MSEHIQHLQQAIWSKISKPITEETGVTPLRLQSQPMNWSTNWTI